MGDLTKPDPIRLQGDPRPPGADRLRSTLFRRGREAGWRNLDSLITRVEEAGITSLSWDEAQQLPLLYRQTVSSLSVARATVLDRNLLLYLENLTLRAYLVVYGPRVSLADKALDFVAAGLPRLVRGMRFHLALAALIFFAGVFAGYYLVMNDPSSFYSLVPETLAGERGPDTGRDELRSVLFRDFPGFADTFIVFANSLFRSNARVGILLFGLGFFFGIPTALLLAYNGLGLGAMAAVYARHGLGLDFWVWLSIHGVTEILAILLCAAAGFVLAESMAFPGRRRRLEKLAENGRAAAGAVCGAVGMFFIAGILEGGLRQLFANSPLRYLCALCTALAWYYYFTRAGKAEDEDDVV